MIGMTKEEIQATIKEMDNKEVAERFNGILPKLLKKYGRNTPEIQSAFLQEYLYQILVPIAAELIEKNNRKIEEDVKALLSER